MTVEYRVITLGDQGEVISCDVLWCGGDQKAIEQVKQMANGRSLELWSGAHFLCRFPASEHQLHAAQDSDQITTSSAGELPISRALGPSLTDPAPSKTPADGRMATSALRRFGEKLSLHTALPRGAVEALCALQGRTQIYEAGKEFIVVTKPPSS